MNVGATGRGFELIEFTDLYGAKCSLQQSSLATEDALWFGPDNANPKIMASLEVRSSADVSSAGLKTQLTPSTSRTPSATTT